MKRIFTIASIALVAVLALSCRKNTSEAPAKYQPAPKLTFNGPGALEFEAEGSEICLLVDTFEPVTVTSSAEWVKVEISGRYIYISAPLNNSIYPRYSTVELTAGDMKASLQAKQHGVPSDYFWEDEYRFESSASSLSLRFFKTLETVRVEIDGQDWISVDLDSDMLTINVAKNPYKQVREGSVTWTAGKDVRVINIVQALNPSGGDDPGDDPGEGGDVLFSEDFEDMDTLNEWMLLDADDDGNGWLYSSQFAAHSGIGLMFSQSYDNTDGALTPDNWVVTPAVSLGQDNYFSCWVAAQDPNYNAEHFGIYVSSENPQTTDDFESLFEGTFPVTGAYEETTVKIQTESGSVDVLYQRIVVKVPASYENGSAHFAIRHFDCTDMFYLNLDDVMVTKGQPAKTSSSSTSVSSVKPAVVATGEYKRK